MADGYWGTITSNYDWCEHNYEFTYYIAEFFNTLSSFPILFAGLYGIINCIRLKYQCKFYVSYIGLSAVGFGSIAFHGTLLREGQVLDEVPMLWCSLTFLYVSFTFKQSSNLLVIFTILYGIICTWIYFYVSFEIFVVAYTLTVICIIGSSIIEMRQLSKYSDPQNYDIVKYGVYSGLFYAGGFLFLWLPEQIICGNRILVQHDSLLTRLQFHAIFHITSTIGPYYWCIFALMMHYRLKKRKPKIIYYTKLNIPVVHIDNQKKH